MGSQDRPYYYADAIAALRRAGFDAEPRAYGFSIQLRDSGGAATGECGAEHDGGISLAVWTGAPPVARVFRATIAQIVEFLLDAQRAIAADPGLRWQDLIAADGEDRAAGAEVGAPPPGRRR